MRRNGENGLLDPLIRDLRQPGAPDSLSRAARARILSRVHAAEPMSRLPRLFLPGYRIAAALVVPAILAGVIGFLSLPLGPAHQAPRLEARKVGDQVVFTIADGKSRHVVYKSTDPRNFEGSQAIEVRDGRFVDSARNGADLVFYLVD